MTADAYATPADYRARSGAGSGGYGDDLLGEVLTAASRHLDRRLGRAAGSFTPDAAASPVEVWPHRPSRVLDLIDASGAALTLQWPPDGAARDDIAVAADYSGDGGTPDWTAGADTDWLAPVGEPGHAAALRLRTARGGRSTWPSDPGTVTVTGRWGRPTPPDIREAVVHSAREMLDSHLGGAAAVIAAFDGGAVDIAAMTGRVWRRIEQRWSAGRMERFGLAPSRAGSGW